MADDFREYVQPISPSAPLDQVQHGGNRPPIPQRREAIHGTVHGIRRGQSHKEGKHRLDVSVGGGDTTELIIRVPNSAYSGLEGKRVVIYVDD